MQRKLSIKPRYFSCKMVISCKRLQHTIFISTAQWHHLSPLGRNAQQCCDGLSLHSIHAVCNKLSWSLFYRNSDLPELDKIQTVKELLRVKYGLISLPLLDVSHIDLMLESLCSVYSVTIFAYFFICTFLRFHIKYINILEFSMPETSGRDSTFRVLFLVYF